LTAQIEESIFIDGQYRPMATCPDFPVDGSRIVKQSEPSFLQENSACWRGYIASWEIRDDRLFLNDISGRYVKSDTKPIHATWYSGTLKIGLGELLEYVHMGFGSVHEKELHLKIKRGCVVRMKWIDNRAVEHGRYTAWYRRWLMGSWWRSQG
jgi:hypothetical protein